MRLFLAQSATLYDYTGLQADFSPCMRGHWRTASSLHATVLYLGYRFRPREIVATVSECDYHLEEAFIKGVDRFAHNRIFYAAADHPTLIQTHRRLSAAFALKHERNYKPHVTLMRYRRIDIGCFEKEKTELEAIVSGKFEGGLKLMRSTLTPSGAVYETLYQF
jgi:2'-5' RNA ligase